MHLQFWLGTQQKVDFVHADEGNGWCKKGKISSTHFAIQATIEALLAVPGDKVEDVQRDILYKNGMQEWLTIGPVAKGIAVGAAVSVILPLGAIGLGTLVGSAALGKILFDALSKKPEKDNPDDKSTKKAG